MRPGPKIPELPGIPYATRALRQKTWTVVLRCYACRGRFAVAKVTLDRLAQAPQAAPCTHCGALPDPTAWTKIHRILDMREETSGGNHGDPPPSAA